MGRGSSFLLGAAGHTQQDSLKMLKCLPKKPCKSPAGNNTCPHPPRQLCSQEGGQQRFPQKEGSQRGTNKRKRNTCPGADITLWHGAPAVSGHGEMAAPAAHPAGRLGVFTADFLLCGCFYGQSPASKGGDASSLRTLSLTPPPHATNLDTSSSSQPESTEGACPPLSCPSSLTLPSVEMHFVVVC